MKKVLVGHSCKNLWKSPVSKNTAPNCLVDPKDCMHLINSAKPHLSKLHLSSYRLVSLSLDHRGSISRGHGRSGSCLVSLSQINSMLTFFLAFTDDEGVPRNVCSTNWTSTTVPVSITNKNCVLLCRSNRVLSRIRVLVILIVWTWRPSPTAGSTAPTTTATFHRHFALCQRLAIFVWCWWRI